MSDRAMAIAMGLSKKSTYFNAALKNTVIALKQSEGKIWGMHIPNIDMGEDAFLQVFDEEPETLTIEEISDGGGGTINLKITGHGRSTGDLAVVAGTTSYDNADAKVPVAITKVDADNFTIVETFVADEAGTVWFPNVILGTTTPKQSYLILSGDGLLYGVLDADSKAIPIDFENEIVVSITKTPTGDGAPTTGKVTNITYR